MEHSCQHCESRPDGIEGHPLLALQADKPRSATFVCGGCGKRWVRVYEGSGTFRWLPANGD